MPPLREIALAQIDDVLARAEITNGQVPTWEAYDHRGEGWVVARLASALSAIDRFSSPDSVYRRTAQDPALSNPSVASIALVQVLGVLLALRYDIDAGYLHTVEELIHADVFADFLEMAGELHSKGYKDPAAVIAGSVLEEHLRKLAAINDVSAESAEGQPQKADRLNADLAKAGAYNKLVQKSITAWLDLRNKAAHGHYDQYSHTQVSELITSIRNFMVAHPA